MHHQLSGLTTYGVKAYGRDRVDQPAYASLSLNVIQLADWQTQLAVCWQTQFHHVDVVAGWMKVIQCLLSGRLQDVCSESNYVIS